MDPSYLNCRKVRVLIRDDPARWETGKEIGEIQQECYGEREDDYGRTHECSDVEILTVVALDSNGKASAYANHEIRETIEKYTLEEMLTHLNEEVRENAHLCFQGVTDVSTV